MGEKKRRQAARGAGPPRHPAMLIGDAFEALQRGDRELAATAFEALQAAPPKEAEALHAAGVLGLKLGDARRAESLLSRAAALDPRNPACRCHLAIAYRRLGKRDLAIETLEAALRLDPGMAEAHSNLGNLLQERRDSEAAARSFRCALAIRTDLPDAWNGLGQTELALGRHAAACSDFERAVALDPAFHEAWYNLSKARMEWASSLAWVPGGTYRPPAAAEHAEHGLASILTALHLAPEAGMYWMQFESCVRNVDLHHPLDPRMQDALSRALDHPEVDPASLVRPIVSLAASRPGAAELQRRLASAEGFAALPRTALEPVVHAVLGDALLQRILQDTVVPYAFVERLVTYARRVLLGDRAHAIPAEPSLPLQAIAAIAHQAFNTEYVGEESAEERVGVAGLKASIAAAHASGKSVPLHAYALYACYRPLHTLDAAERIAADLARTPLRTLAMRQIDEPLLEQRLRPTIAALTGIVGEVSVAVRSQYEANPYPRWQRVRRSAVSAPGTHFLRERFPEADLGGMIEAPCRILVAGCGTGRHPVGTAARFPEAAVLAVDLSLTSLAYAKRKTLELGIGNIEYRQGDILALGSIGQRFDVIECTGVLHHLEDPVAGWNTLCSLLAPGGAMRVGLYSEIARRHVVRARDLVAAAGYAATPEGIRACRAAIRARPDDELLARVTRGEDFYSLSGCRDLIFHVQEHRFTLPRIAEMLERLSLAFIGFEFPDGAAAARYRARFPGDRALRNLDRWHELETTAPDTFALMYQFWVRKRA